VVEDDGVGHQHHRQHEVAHDQRRIEMGEDDEPAQDDLAEHAENETDGEPGQVPPVRPAAQGGQDRHDDHDRHGAGDSPVDELDEGVVLERRHDAPFGAGRPVGAAEARAGDPHRSAGDDDERQSQQGEERDPAVARRGDREPFAHRTPGLPIAASDAAPGGTGRSGASPGETGTCGRNRPLHGRFLPRLRWTMMGG
jgi:hypothetical protein